MLRGTGASGWSLLREARSKGFGAMGVDRCAERFEIVSYDPNIAGSWLPIVLYSTVFPTSICRSWSSFSFSMTSDSMRYFLTRRMSGIAGTCAQSSIWPQKAVSSLPTVSRPQYLPPQTMVKAVFCTRILKHIREGKPGTPFFCPEQLLVFYLSEGQPFEGFANPCKSKPGTPAYQILGSIHSTNWTTATTVLLEPHGEVDYVERQQPQCHVSRRPLIERM